MSFSFSSNVDIFLPYWSSQNCLSPMDPILPITEAPKENNSSTATTTINISDINQRSQPMIFAFDPTAPLDNEPTAMPSLESTTSTAIQPLIHTHSPQILPIDIESDANSAHFTSLPLPPSTWQPHRRARRRDIDLLMEDMDRMVDGVSSNNRDLSRERDRERDRRSRHRHRGSIRNSRRQRSRERSRSRDRHSSAVVRRGSPVCIDLLSDSDDDDNGDNGDNGNGDDDNAESVIDSAVNNSDSNDESIVDTIESIVANTDSDNEDDDNISNASSGVMSETAVIVGDTSDESSDNGSVNDSRTRAMRAILRPDYGSDNGSANIYRTAAMRALMREDYDSVDADFDNFDAISHSIANINEGTDTDAILSDLYDDMPGLHRATPIVIADDDDDDNNRTTEVITIPSVSISPIDTSPLNTSPPASAAAASDAATDGSPSAPPVTSTSTSLSRSQLEHLADKCEREHREREKKRIRQARIKKLQKWLEEDESGEIEAEIKNSMTTCPICQSKMDKLSSTVCGHLYCWDCIHEYCNQNSSGIAKCPICIQPIRSNQIHRIFI